MARVLDFNELQSSFLDITLRDEARTVVHLDLPNEALINELENMDQEIENMKTGTRCRSIRVSRRRSSSSMNLPAT